LTRDELTHRATQQLAQPSAGPAAALRGRLVVLCALVVLSALTVVGAHVALGATTAPSAPTVVLSPLNGTPDADPSSQISFLGAPASHLRDIVVTGSRSGAHAGRLLYYSTHTGGSFQPARPFTPGRPSSSRRASSATGRRWRWARSSLSPRPTRCRTPSPRRRSRRRRPT